MMKTCVDLLHVTSPGGHARAEQPSKDQSAAHSASGDSRARAPIFAAGVSTWDLPLGDRGLDGTMYVPVCLAATEAVEEAVALEQIADHRLQTSEAQAYSRLCGELEDLAELGCHLREVLVDFGELVTWPVLLAAVAGAALGGRDARVLGAGALAWSRSSP
jgi:hypothetical protein